MDASESVIAREQKPSIDGALLVEHLLKDVRNGRWFATRLLNHLARRAGQNGGSYTASAAVIARKLGATEPTVRGAMRYLRGIGAELTYSSTSRPGTWTFTLPRGGAQ